MLELLTKKEVRARHFPQESLIDVVDIGLVDYEKAYDLQKELVRKRRLKLIPDTLVLVEHSPVFTIGRRGSKENLLISEDTLKNIGIELIETDRGGDITFHGTGQMVLYPILDLSQRKKDIHLYIRNLEEVIIDFLSQYELNGIRVSGATGVWINKDTKIASIGIGVSKWITYHGLSVNINTQLHYFDMIISCGLTGCRMTSLSHILRGHIDIKKAKKKLISSFEKIFCI